jgi:hypothetical protein
MSEPWPVALRYRTDHSAPSLLDHPEQLGALATRAQNLLRYIGRNSMLSAANGASF